ncbi:MAG: hypothetical protein ACE5MG_06560 [Candidatus Methylomirabilales bacterium]
MRDFRNIRISQGVIGTVNIGHLQVIDVAVSHIQQSGDLALSHALWEFTQTVLESSAVDPVARKDMIEQLALLSDQMLTSENHEQQGAARAVLGDLATKASTIEGLDLVWQELFPLLRRALL